MLTRIEEIILLGVHQLADNAYGLQIRKHVEHATGRRFSIGAIYVPLERLTRQGFLKSYEGDPTPTRGGRRKRYYEVTPEGLFALAEIRRLHEKLWADVPDLETK